MFIFFHGMPSWPSSIIITYQCSVDMSYSVIPWLQLAFDGLISLGRYPGPFFSFFCHFTRCRQASNSYMIPLWTLSFDGIWEAPCHSHLCLQQVSCLQSCVCVFVEVLYNVVFLVPPLSNITVMRLWFLQHCRMGVRLSLGKPSTKMTCDVLPRERMDLHREFDLFLPSFFPLGWRRIRYGVTGENVVVIVPFNQASLPGESVLQEASGTPLKD